MCLCSTVHDFDTTIKYYGEPKTAQGDNAEEFDSKNLREFFDSHEIAIVHGPAYCPTAQSYVERYNKTFSQIMTTVFLRAPEEIKHDMNAVVDSANQVYQQTYHSSLGVTPFMYGCGYNWPNKFPNNHCRVTSTTNTSSDSIDDFFCYFDRTEKLMELRLHSLNKTVQR